MHDNNDPTSTDSTIPDLLPGEAVILPPQRLTIRETARENAMPAQCVPLLNEIGSKLSDLLAIPSESWPTDRRVIIEVGYLPTFKVIVEKK